MTKNLLSKTDFVLARECPTKLYYSKNRYRSTAGDDEYAELLKEGGFVIGEMARILFPGGELIGIGEDVEESARRTAEALRQEQVTLFEAVFIVDGMLVVADIVDKQGKDISLIEVKSKSYDSTVEDLIVGKKGVVRSEWTSYIDDIAYQTFVVRSVMKECVITPYLLLPDKSKKSGMDSLASMFSLKRKGDQDRGSFEVSFSGDPSELRNSNFLSKVNVEEPVRCVMPLIEQEAHRFVELLQPQLRRAEPNLSKICKDCEFNLGESGDGYHECWKELADTSPHIFDLYYGGLLKIDGRYLLDKLISERKVSLFDIPESAIKGKRGERQSVQINCTRSKEEWVNPVLRDVLRSAKYPLHFIDFETSTSAVPYHKGMRPYEQIAFQWSCHTIAAQGEAPVHSEWINLKEAFPSFEFARSLKEALGDTGTILTWSDHESRTLKEIRRQAVEYGGSLNFKDIDQIIKWIDRVVPGEESDGRILDMNELCIEHYFHPDMKGRTSIKYVLPAIWNNNCYLWEIPYFSEYFLKNPDGKPTSPYEILPSIEIHGSEQVIKAGTGAMRAYEEMVYGISRNDPTIKDKWSKLLLQYCRLDTMAMIIIWTHWRKLVKA